jgi:hypothetical protein
MNKYRRFAFLGAVTGVSLLSSSPYANAGEIIRCTKKPNEYRLYHLQCPPDTRINQPGGPYTS